MDSDQIELTLVRAPDDPAQFGNEYQAGLETVDTGLRECGLRVTALAAHQGGDGTLLGQFLVTLGPAVVSAAAAVAGAWVQARYGRKVRLKFGDVEAEGRTPEEIERLLKLAAEFQDRKSTASKDGP